MTNSNESVVVASTASRTTKEIYREIENVKDLIAQSTLAEKSAPKHGAKARRAERKALRSELWQLRDEWDRVALEASRFNSPRVCRTHQEIVASALTKFVVDARVDGIFSHHNTHAARRVLRELAAAGYKIVKVRAH
jgi:hypothetical protein